MIFVPIRFNMERLLRFSNLVYVINKYINNIMNLYTSSF